MRPALSSFSTRRPVAVLMVFLAVVVFGFFSYSRLPVTLMPELSYPTLTVRTEYPGSAPEEVENDISRPVEEALGVISGLTRISSISRAGVSDVVLELSWDTDMSDAIQDTLEKLDLVFLPPEAERPLILRFDPSLDPVLELSLSGRGERFAGEEGLRTLRRISELQVRRALEPIKGVAAVRLRGGLEEEIEVLVDDESLRRTGLSIQRVIDRLRQENVNVAGGTIKEGRTEYMVRTLNEYKNLDQIRDTVVARLDGRDIRLHDVARVKMGHKEREILTRTDGGESVQIDIFKEADANMVALSKAVRARLGELDIEVFEARRAAGVTVDAGGSGADGGEARGGLGRRRPPPEVGLTEQLYANENVYLEVVADRSIFIESSISEVRNTALMGGLLAVLVLFCFLRNAKSTLIIAVSIPISLMVTFAPLNLLGVTLNIMSLGGLALGIGMLVDSSIVVLESIYRCREEGDGLVTAAVRGTREVRGAVIASTLTSIAVFFPMVFVEGVAGQAFGDLGLAVVISLLVSVVVAVSFIPMLASRGGLKLDDGQATRGEVVRSRALAIANLDLHRAWRWLSSGPMALRLLPYCLFWLYVHVRLVLQLALELVLHLLLWLLSLIFFCGKMLWAVVRGAPVFDGASAASGATGSQAKGLLWQLRSLKSLRREKLSMALWWSRHRLAGALALALTLPIRGAFYLFMVLTEAVVHLLLTVIAWLGWLVAWVLRPLIGIVVWLARRLMDLFRALGEGYGGALRWAVAHPGIMIAVTVGLFSVTAWVGSRLDSELLPEVHQGELTVEVAMPVGTPLESTDQILRPVEQAILEEKQHIRSLLLTVGYDAANSQRSDEGEHTARFKVLLESSDPRLEDDVVRRLRRRFQEVPDLDARVVRPVLFSFKTPIEVEVHGDDLTELRRYAERVRQVMASFPELADVETTLRAGAPEVQIVYNRDLLARYDLNIQEVANLVRNSVKGFEATRYNLQDRRIPILVRFESDDRASVEDIRDLVVNPGADRPIPLSAVAAVTLGEGPSEVRRIDGRRVALVRANISQGSLGAAVERIRQDVLRQVDLPPSMTFIVAGQSQEWERSRNSLLLALGLSIFLVYVIMAAQFESLIHPLVIMFTIPLAFLGTFLALAGLHISLSIVVFLGMIMLAGIVVNNAIVLVDYINTLKSRGLPRDEAIVTAGQVRLRPILMTTATTVLGLMPMALGLGDGAEIRTPMAIAVISGLVVSTFLTLLIIPAIYAALDRLQSRFSHRSTSDGDDVATEDDDGSAFDTLPGVEPEALTT